MEMNFEYWQAGELPSIGNGGGNFEYWQAGELPPIGEATPVGEATVNIIFEDMTIDATGKITTVAQLDIVFADMVVTATATITNPPPSVPPLPSTNRQPRFFATLQTANFAALPNLPFKLKPVRWSWARPGGCARAEIEITGQRDDVWNSLPSLLRSPVTIRNNNHTKVWWGYVHAVELYSDDMTVGISLDGLYNNVAVDYRRLDAGSTSATDDQTTFAQDDDSVERWGEKSLRVGFGETTAAGADLVRDLYLSRYRYITPDVREGGNAKLAGKLHCRGWWEVLGWQYYANAGTTATDISQQIADIVASQTLIVGSDIVDTHTTQTNEYRDGSQTALEIIESLLKIPQSPTVGFTATVTPERYLRFFQECASTTTDWLLMSDGQFRTFVNGIPDPGSEILGWSQLRGVLPASNWGYMISPSPFFIEENEFDANSLTYSWRARGAQSAWG